MNKDNYELNKNEIIENVVLNQLAIFKNSRAICTCGEIPCCDCIFDDYDEGCREARKKWLSTIPKKFTEEEKQFVKVAKFNWYARDNDGTLFGYVNKPHYDKILELWDCHTGAFLKVSSVLDLKFNSITGEETEPISKEEILNS